MRFEPYGPFEIPRKKNGRVDSDKESMAEFWSAVDSERDNLSTAVGCYIFSLRAGRGVLPWYVGMAEKQHFNKECFTSHKLVIFNVLLASRKGTPLLMLLPKLTTTGRNAKRSKNGHRDIRFLENMLISLAVQRNSELANVKQTKLIREMVVPGVLNTPAGRNKQPVNDLKTLLGA